MRQDLLSKVKTGLGLLMLSAPPVVAQSVRQGFEGTAADTWSFTATPATYNFPNLNDIWAAVPSVGTTVTGTSVQAGPAAGAALWGMQDLQNPTVGDVPAWHFLDFAPITLQSGTAAANIVSFQYFSNGFESTDSLAYGVVFDDGTIWPAPKTYPSSAKTPAPTRP